MLVHGALQQPALRRRARAFGEARARGVGVEIEALSGHRRDGLAVVLMNPQALLEAQRELRPSVALGRHQAARPRRRRRRLRHALVTWSLEENQ